MASNHTKTMYEQLEKQIEKTEKYKERSNFLKKEADHYKRNYKKLQIEMDEFKAQVSDMIAVTVKQAVHEATEPLKMELAKAHDEIKRLKAIIKKDSSNSSKPPSTDGFNKVMNSRVPSNKKRGGQKGHTGHRLSLPENMDKLEKEGILEKRLVDHTNGSKDYIVRHVVDVEIKVIVTEHRFKNKVDIPKEMLNEVSYGDELKAFSIILMNDGMIANKRLSQIISGLTNNTINLSTGTFVSFRKQFVKKLEAQGALEEIIEDVLNQEVIHVDDTSLKVLQRPNYPEESDEDQEIKMEQAKKKTFNSTLRTYSSKTSTLYTINPGKGDDGIKRDNILPRYHGTIVQDGESKFFNYGINNGLCHAHILRKLKGLKELCHCEWAGGAMEQFMKMSDHKNNDIANGIKECDQTVFASFGKEYNQLIEDGRVTLRQMEEVKESWGYDELRKMLNFLEKRKDNILLFLKNYEIPSTNNQAERDLRADKIKQKVSGMFRSWEGLKDHIKIRSFASTAKKRDFNIASAIKSVFKGNSLLTR